jgi:hypothetical protein
MLDLIFTIVLSGILGAVFANWYLRRRYILAFDADVYVHFTDLITTAGNKDKMIFINRKWFYDLDATQQGVVLVHEFAHAVWKKKK